MISLGSQFKRIFYSPGSSPSLFKPVMSVESSNLFKNISIMASSALTKRGPRAFCFARTGNRSFYHIRNSFNENAVDHPYRPDSNLPSKEVRSEVWESFKIHDKIAKNDLSFFRGIERSFTLQDGTKASVCLLGLKDEKDVELLYETAPDYARPDFLRVLDTNAIIGIKSLDKEGNERLVAISYYERFYQPGEKNSACEPRGTSITEEFQNRGIEVELLRTLIDCARQERMCKVAQWNLSKESIKLWQKVADALNLPFYSSEFLYHQIYVYRPTPTPFDE
jgi:GNAT superfamily N-acetyltransferase